MKNKIKVRITDNLKSDLKEYAKNYSVGIATKIRDELTDTTQMAIEKFYADYTPKTGNINTSYQWKYYTPSGVPNSYRRHYTNFLNNSFKKYYYNPHNTLIKGGVELTPESLLDIYGYDKNYIFNLVYSGYHGNMTMINSNYEVQRMNPTPLEIILDKHNEIIKNINTYKKYGIERTKNTNYKTLR